MRKKDNRGHPSQMSDLLERLQRINRDLERLHYVTDIDHDQIAKTDDDLLKLAQNLMFIWNSRQIFIDSNLIMDPGWLILLNLKIAELSHAKLQVSAVCIDSGAPATTALRWIKLLESKALVRIEPDKHDRRRKFVFLTDDGSVLLARYLQNIHNYISTRGSIA